MARQASSLIICILVVILFFGNRDSLLQTIYDMAAESKTFEEQVEDMSEKTPKKHISCCCYFEYWECCLSSKFFSPVYLPYPQTKLSYLKLTIVLRI